MGVMRLLARNQVTVDQLFPCLRDAGRTLQQSKEIARTPNLAPGDDRAHAQAVIGYRACRHRPKLDEVLRHDAQVCILLPQCSTAAAASAYCA